MLFKILSSNKWGQQLTLSSEVARGMPMHFLGPAPQGANPAGSFLHHAPNILPRLKRAAKVSTLLNIVSEPMGAGGHKSVAPPPFCSYWDFSCTEMFC